ncbi:VanZ family protein [Candidatus Curtissbacteria bacterium]|nr:VanZ family protein [Candidatus Curtissbacteria bacterium]
MRKKVRERAIRWLPPFLWAIVIFALSSIEQIATSRVFVWDFFIKKFAHVSEYAVLFGLIYRATHGNWISAYVLTIIYAATDEYHQSFVPGRTATFLDLGIDFSGANIAAYCLWKLNQIRSKKPKK